MNEGITEELAAAEESIELRQRFKVERAAFIVIAAIIVGVFAGNTTDLGPLGLAFMVGLMMASFYIGANFLLGIGGGFTESVPADEKIPNFDWKRFALDPLYFLGICLALAIFTGIVALIRGDLF